MAAVAAALAVASTAFSSIHFSPSILTKACFCRTRPSLRIFSSHTEFNITFAPSPTPPKTLTPNPSSNPGLPSEDQTQQPQSGQLFIPWIVRDENGNLTLQSQPPARFVQAMAFADTVEKKRKKTVKPTKDAGAQPKHSKAARRFYNENFREPPQRLSKVLAAAGVASRRSSEELIFQGRVTVNGSVCNTPQTRVDPGRDIIYVNGNRLPKKLPPKVYFALNKPKGYICSAGEKESKSVMCLFDAYMKSWVHCNNRRCGQQAALSSPQCGSSH